MAKIATAISTKELIEVGQQHCYFELVEKDDTAALGNHVRQPARVDGASGDRRPGRHGVYNFYLDDFLAQLPALMTAVPISQVVGENILAEEAVYRFTHDQVMDWLVPGVPPTGKTRRGGGRRHHHL